MSDRTRKPGPQVEVIRRPASGSTPAAAPVRPTQPTPTQPTAAVRPARPADAAPRPQAARPFRGPPRGAPRPPPTPEQVAELARRERVPARIAKGDLEGKMKCRIWKKLHAEEAQRFDQAYILMGQHPGLELADAFGVVQSGMAIDEFLARRARAKKREAIKEARATVPGEAVDALLGGWQAREAELAVVLGERTMLDTLAGVQPVSFTFGRSGQVEKLQVVAMATRETWDALLPSLPRDARLAQKPPPAARHPARRPVNDPRAFLPRLGSTVTLQLRNGLTLTAPLLAVGPFDVVTGEAGREVFVPLHALLGWSTD